MRSHPIFARFYDWLARKAESTEIAIHRDRLLAGLRGRVVEIGVGNGMNFAHYPSSVHDVVALEPEPYLRARARSQAARVGIPIQVVGGDAHRLPFRDGSADAAVVSLVLCSVSRPDQALAELRRVLRAGGELRFYEHVRAPGPAHARFQQAVDRIWPVFTGGCHTSRETPASIEGAGFQMMEMKRFDLGPRFGNPIAPHVLGIARAPEEGS